MTQDMSGYPPPQGTGVAPSGPSSTKDVAREEAAGVGRQASQAGSQVAQTATEQAKEVTAEARRQGRDLLDQGLGQVRDQASDGQRRAAEQLRSLADELREMSEKADSSGMARDLVRQVADKTESAATWLENREPGDVLEEFRGFARRRPGAFLFGAAVAGVVAGRLTKGAVAAQQPDTTSGPAHLDTYSAPPVTPAPGPVYGQHAAGGWEPGPPTYTEPDYRAPAPGYADPGYAAPAPQPGPGPAYGAPVPPREGVGEPRYDEYGTGGTYPPGQVRP